MFQAAAGSDDVSQILEALEDPATLVQELSELRPVKAIRS
jgi:hypothetical protein